LRIKVKNVDFEEETIQPDEERGISSWAAILVTIIIFAVFAGMFFAVVALIKHPQETETIRDVVIIFVAVESLFIGLALILLIVQIARLTALIQTEIKPLIESGSETVNTLRGTSQFLSDKMVRPAIRISSTYAAVRRAVDLIKSGRSKSR
jgi:hypothetical protein